MSDNPHTDVQIRVAGPSRLLWATEDEFHVYVDGELDSRWLTREAAETRALECKEGA